MKEKGFTLIELLAVIVILAVIALIATPLIMGVIGEAKEGALKTSVRNLIDSAELEYAKQLMINQNPSLAFEDIPYKGQKFEKGSISFDDKGQASIAVYENNMCVYKTPTDKDVIVDKTINEEECLGKIELAVTPTSCFAYEKINYLDSYEIAVEACKTFFTANGTFNESEIDTFCNGGELEDGMSIKNIITNMEDGITILENAGIIVNVVTKEVINIYDYTCYDGNDYGNPIITDVVIPNQIEGLDVIYISRTDEIAYNSLNKDNNIELMWRIIGPFDSKNLTSVKLPSKLRYIGGSAFAYNNLTDTVSIPSSVEYIGSGAFQVNTYFWTRPTINNDIIDKAFSNLINHENNSDIIPLMVSDSNPNLNNIVNYSDKMFDWSEVMDSKVSFSISKTALAITNNNNKIVAITNEPLGYDVNTFVYYDESYTSFVFENIPDDITINYQNSSTSTWTKIDENTKYNIYDNLKIQFIKNNKIILETGNYTLEK